MTSPTRIERPLNPWLAVLLSLVATGVGHVYCGRVRRGALLFAVWLLLLPATAIAARVEPSTAVLLGGLLLPIALVIATVVVACVDAWRLARRDRAPRLRVVRPVALYSVLLLVGATYPFLVMSTAREHAFEAFRLAGTSMEPDLRAGDRVLANKLLGSVDGHSIARLRRGEVVVFRSPEVPGELWIRRVAGCAGERIELRDGTLRVDGEAVTLPGSCGPQVDMPALVVPEGRVFVLGDALGCSRDSRHFGAIPLTDVIAVVQYLFLPAGGWSRFGRLAD